MTVTVVVLVAPFVVVMFEGELVIVKSWLETTLSVNIDEEYVVFPWTLVTPMTTTL